MAAQGVARPGKARVVSKVCGMAWQVGTSRDEARRRGAGLGVAGLGTARQGTF